MLYKLGDVEIWRILDLHGPFMAPEELFPNAGPEVSQIIERDSPGSICGETGHVILPIQGFLLKTPEHIILVDSCVGNHKTMPNLPIWHQLSGTRFMASLTAAGVTPEDVDYVLCTHLHSDHIGWNTRLEDGRWVPTFPNARYLMPPADEAELAARNTQPYQESVLPVVAAGQAEAAEAGMQIGKDLTLIPTPGHSPGHVSVQIESGGCTALITGDALHITAQCAHPEWHFKFDVAPEQAVASRKRLLETAVETRATVLGMHFALPSIGRVEADAHQFRWKPLGD